MNVGQTLLDWFFRLSKYRVDGKLHGIVKGTPVATVGKRMLLTANGIPRSPPLEVQFEGGSVSVVRGYSPVHYYRERGVLEDFVASIEAGDVVYDVGADAGLYACAATTSSPGDVIAFEPLDERVEGLESNVAANDLDDEIRVEQVALGADSGELALTEDGTPGENGSTVPVASGDDLSIAPPDVMKMDVEGTELEALRGMSTSLRQCRVVYVECHPGLREEISPDCKEIEERLRDAGLEPSVLREFPERRVLKARRDRP